MWKGLEEASEKEGLREETVEVVVEEGLEEEGREEGLVEGEEGAGGRGGGLRGGRVHLRQHESRHEFHDEGIHVGRPGGAVVTLGELLEGPGGALEVGAPDLHPVRRLARLHAAQR